MNNKKFQDVVKAYRLDMSYRAFADELIEGLPNQTLSGQTVWRWETLPNSAPDLYFLFDCLATYRDRRRAFAIDSLQAVLPHIFGDDGLAMVMFRRK
jgi:hypothetical protein